MLRIYETALSLVDDFNPMLEQLEKRRKPLFDQLDQALSSVVLNIAEGCGQSGGHRRERFKTALGSAREVRGNHDYAVRRRLAQPVSDDALDKLEKVIATLINLIR